jgi:hypothetical protein
LYAINLTVHEVAVAEWTRLDSLTVGIVITFELSFDLDVGPTLRLQANAPRRSTTSPPRRAARATIRSLFSDGGGAALMPPPLAEAGSAGASATLPDRYERGRGSSRIEAISREACAEA